jgi:NAD(P)-dependent dehydrogenase (short-subunit alcohol dehydrogenase family)
MFWILTSLERYVRASSSACTCWSVGFGRFVNIASLNSFVALNEVTEYAASKAGVVSLTRSLAVEWPRKDVKVNAIAPARP